MMTDDILYGYKEQLTYGCEKHAFVPVSKNGKGKEGSWLMPEKAQRRLSLCPHVQHSLESWRESVSPDVARFGSNRTSRLDL
jgi:hypothetical protein